MQDITIKRTGQPPLTFSGDKIGHGSTEIFEGQRSNRWTTVDLYITKGGRFIAAVTNRTIWQGEHDYTKAASFKTPAEVLNFLKDDEGSLGRASQEACEEAAVANEQFKSSYVEPVD